MKFKRRTLLFAMLAAGLVSLGAGCGGINASHSVSPASFFLPGLMMTDPQQDAPTDLPPPAEQPVRHLAQAN